MKKPKKAGKLRTKIIWVFLILIVAVIITPWGRAFYKTLIILPEFIPNSPVRPMDILTPQPQVIQVQFESENRSIFADLWLPKAKGKYPAAVLSLGVDIDRSDPRAQKLANALARSGIATLVPNIPSLSFMRVMPEGRDDLVASFEYLKSLPSINPQKVGFVGFCASGSLVLLAAEEPKIADTVDFVVSVNSYYDLSSLYKSLTTRQIEDDGQILNWKPNSKTVEVFNRETIELLERKEDKEILHRHLTYIDPWKLEAAEFPSLTSSELDVLSEEAKLTYELLTNKDPEKVSFYLKGQTDAQRSFISKLSPATNIAGLKAQTFILTDINNVYLPYTEDKLLDKALEGKRHSFVQTKILPAGELAENISLRDYLPETVKIFGFLYSFFAKIS